MFAQKVSALLLISLGLGVVPAVAEKSQKWLEIKSPHFVVLTNGNEKNGRRAADQFERIRSVFHTAFPKIRVDPDSPIIVLAVRDEASFRDLQSIDRHKKGALQLAGLFQRGEDKNFVLFRQDVSNRERNHVIYHEYTHLILSMNPAPVPLWFDEGLAEFFGNTEIENRQVLLGEPSVEHLQTLRENKLLPLETLFAVDHASPYYNEQKRGTIFYAESWALTHYLHLKMIADKSNSLGNFMDYLMRGGDAKTAATSAFGSLAKLQTDLEAYIRQSSMNFLKLNVQTEKEEDAFATRELTGAESAAARGDFLVHCQLYGQAKGFLDQALRENPKLALAHEAMGFLEFRQNHLPEAGKWFAQAVELDSQNYLALYYHAALILREADGYASTPAEVSLRAAIKINPNFAPAYATLASYFASRGDSLSEARVLALRAVELEPRAVNNLLVMGSVELRMKRADDAVRVGERARAVAKSPQETAAVESFLENARKYQEYLAAREKFEKEHPQAAAQPSSEFVRIQVATGPSRESASPGLEPAGSKPVSSSLPPSGPPRLQHRDASGEPSSEVANLALHAEQEPPAVPPQEVETPPAQPAESQRPSGPPPVVPPLAPVRKTPAPAAASGQRAAASGRVISVICSPPAAMNLTIDFGTSKLLLHASNYLRVSFLTATGQPYKSIHPCQQIQGMWGRAVYRVAPGKALAGEIISLQIEE